MEAVFGFGQSHSQGGNEIVKTRIESLVEVSVAAVFPSAHTPVVCGYPTPVWTTGLRNHPRWLEWCEI